MRRFAIGALAVATLLFLIPAAQSHAQGHAQGHYGQGGGSYHGGGGYHGGGWHGGGYHGGGWHGGGYHGGGYHGGGWHGGTRVVVGVAPGWGFGWGWGPGWFYPPPFYYGYGAGYYGYGSGPPVVVQEPAPEYIQQEPQQESLPSGYWYYCASARDYYPSVPSCPEAWIQVPPAPDRR
jgi:hypothetical protein